MLFVSVRSGKYRTVTILLILLIAWGSNYWPLVMMRTNNSKRSVPTNRLPDWDLGVDYVEINAREKSKQILLNHCRKKYSFPCLGASNFDQERQKSGFQRRCNAHIGPNDIENSSSSDWRRPCIDCLSWWEIWLFAMLLLISGIILDMRSKCLVGCKNGLSAA